MMEDNSQIIEKITKIVNPFVEEMNLSLVDVEYLQDGGYWYVRIFIENLNGELSIEDCSKLSSKIEDKVEELIEHKFFLEVSSPGLERALKKLEDYIRFTGEKITLHLKHKLNDRNYKCYNCGIEIDRDYNASINLEKAKIYYKVIA